MNTVQLTTIYNQANTLRKTTTDTYDSPNNIDTVIDRLLHAMNATKQPIQLKFLSDAESIINSELQTTNFSPNIEKRYRELQTAISQLT